MKTKHLWFAWLYLFVLCAVLGFIPEPNGLVKALLVVLGVGFFVPGFWLMLREEKKTVTIITAVSAGVLVVSMALIIANFASALLSEIWGKVLYVLLVIFTTPMVCSQIWILALFGWACLLATGIFRLFSLKK